MDRLEVIREIIDGKLNNIQNDENRKYAYLHLYGVSQFASMLALKRGANVEYCAIAGMLHDIALYTNNCGHKEHAEKSSIETKEILNNTKLFTEDEVAILASMVAKHSDKLQKDDNIHVEIIKDADVLAHYFYNIKIPIPEKDKVRLYYLLEQIKA